MQRKISKLVSIQLLVLLVLVSSASAQSVIDETIKEICGLMLNDLGALLTVVAGFGAVVAAAFGAYKAFFSAIITAIGCFVTPNILGFYFPAAGTTCDSAPAPAGGGGGAAVQRSVAGEFGNSNVSQFQPAIASASSRVEIPRPTNEPVGEVQTRVTRANNDPFQEDSLDNF